MQRGNLAQQLMRSPLSDEGRANSRWFHQYAAVMALASIEQVHNLKVGCRFNILNAGHKRAGCFYGTIE
jgi:hypothetical protein